MRRRPRATAARSTARSRSGGSCPGSRATNLAGALHDVASSAGRYDAPRALTAFTTLDATRLLRDEDDAGGDHRHRGRRRRGLPLLPRPRLPVPPARELQPLNADAVRHDARVRPRSPGATGARVPTKTGLTWEYLFPFGGGTAPWTSGRHRRPARRLLARRDRARRPDLPRHRAQAFRAAQALFRQLPAGPWVRLYSFSSMAVLNAQLQTDSRSTSTRPSPATPPPCSTPIS